MKTVVALLAIPVALAFLASAMLAQDKGKEVTLKGTILCAKCALKETKECQTAIQMKEGTKTVTYYFHDKGMDETYHEPICGGERKEGTVVGKVHEHDGKKMIVPSKVDYVPAKP